MELSQSQIKLERTKAKELRKSRWWQNLIQKAKCYYCGIHLQPIQVTMDHIVPVSRGGRSNKGNLVPCCKACNNEKKNLTTIEWQNYLVRLEKNFN